MSRRRVPSPDAKARAQRIADALADLLEPTTTDDEPTSAAPDNAVADPYRAGPRIPKPTASGRVGLTCPGCDGPMSIEYEYERGVELHRCEACDGLWLDPGELRALVAHTTTVRTVHRSALRREMRAVSAGPQAVVYRTCPRCPSVMHRYNYGRSSGVIVDRCQTHGVFLDPGEFEAIERFIQLGGHTFAAQDEEERLRQRQQRIETARLEKVFKPATIQHQRGRDFWVGLFDWLFS